jgi:hypothetical protein
MRSAVIGARGQIGSLLVDQLRGARFPAFGQPPLEELLSATLASFTAPTGASGERTAA